MEDRRLRKWGIWANQMKQCVDRNTEFPGRDHFYLLDYPELTNHTLHNEKDIS